jgi:DNA-binding transcriptional regulator YhcF (GntR family)
VTGYIEVDTTHPTPPYEQIRAQLAAMIRRGELAPGDRLPPVRQLAADLTLAVGTVARAYRELEMAGLVETRRGGGTTVTEGPHGGGEGVTLARHALDYVAAGRRLGASDDELIAAVRAAVRGQVEPPRPEP